MYFQKSLQYLPVLSTIAHATAASFITATPNLLAKRQDGSGSPSCAGFYSAENSCASATADFTSLAFSQQASCLCYSGSSYAPSIYDGYVSTCVAYLSTASPSFYSTDLGGTGFPTAPCAELASPTSGGTAPLVTSSASYDANAAACASWDAVQVSCSKETSSFEALSFSVEASCLCYSASTYAPSIYDGLWGSCLAFYKTANSTFYSQSLGGDAEPRTPCAAVGNVMSSPSMTGIASSSATISPSASSGPAITSASAQQTSITPPSSTVLTTTEPSATGSSSSGAVPVGEINVALGALAGLAAFWVVL